MIKKVDNSFLVPQLSGPRITEARFSLKGVVSGSPKDRPLGVRRCMTWVPRMRQRKTEWAQ